jgi:hypothetical protein
VGAGYDIARLRLSQALALGGELRKLGESPASLEEVGGRMVRHLYDALRDPQTGERQCVLVRFYKTHLYSELDPDLCAFVRKSISSDELAPSDPRLQNLVCLVLLASVGARPEWSSRLSSVAHRAIPLLDEALLARIPMISQLVNQLGVPMPSLFRSDARLMLDQEQRTYNVFHVADAHGSPYIPAQNDFVLPYHVQSVIGFGGQLLRGNLFAVVLFANTRIAEESASMFRNLALSVKVGLLPSMTEPTFARPSVAGASSAHPREDQP